MLLVCVMFRMDHVDLNIAVFTNLATDAAEEGEFEELLEAQGAIFRRLTNPTTQRAIINLDGAFPAHVLYSWTDCMLSL